MNFIYVLSILCISLLLHPGSSGGKNEGNYPGNPLILTDHNNQSLKQIPVLCYHHIKTLKKGNSPAYSISPETFRAHIKMLSDSGYTVILPGQLYEYLARGKKLPSKSIMISFDDGREEHFSIAAPILKRFGFKAVFFVMTVVIGKPSYLTAAQIKELSNSGHIIASHTWDHQNMKKLKEQDWDLQLSGPGMLLEKITGSPVQYFAYPYGAWDEKAVQELKKQGIQAAFQLSGKQSEKDPLYTIRRLMVNGNWPASALYKMINTSF